MRELYRLLSDDGWLSVILLIGIIVAVYYVYKHREKLLKKPF